MTDPTIITPDNLPEIGEMVECVYTPENLGLTVYKRYKVSEISYGKYVRVENDLGLYESYCFHLFRRLPENVKSKEPMNELKILVDDPLLIEPLKKVLNLSGIRWDLEFNPESGTIPIWNTKGVWVASFQSITISTTIPQPELLPLSNWKEVRRRIEELVKPKETTVRMSYGGVAKINSENVAFWVGEMSIFEASKQDLQTILENMK